jgi:UDP-2,4-diacetamido-2,4,6-trideoxy-beta-L-altropyranose hydrolase
MGIGKLLVRADATPQIGTGHVMRCLALAQTWQDRGGQACFATHNCVPGIRQRLARENIEVHTIDSDSGSTGDSDETRSLIQALRPEWVVIDGFCFTAEYISRVRCGGVRSAVIDDHGIRERYDTDLVINPNIFASPQMYSAKDAQTQLLTGLRFALLRREFRALKRRRESPSISKCNLLVTLGGSDPDNVSVVILEALANVAADDLEITVICGTANRRLAMLQSAAQQLRHPVRLLQDVQNMGEVLAGADMAISAPGASASELAALGVPMLLITMAANHERTGEEFASRGFAASLGWWNRMTVPELAAHIEAFLGDRAGRERRATLAAQHIDCLGPERIVDKMTAIELGAIA